MSYANDRVWSDRFIPTIKRILGPLLLEESPVAVDREQATDLIVIHGRTVHIACRVRRFGFSKEYGHQFTVRSKRDNGQVTELPKIIDGFADWMFYGHAADSATNRIDPWMVINLDAFRSHLIRDRCRHHLKHGRQRNDDGTHFTWFDIRSFIGSPEILIAKSDSLKMEAITT